MRRCIVVPVEVMQPDLSSHDRKQQKHKKKTDRRTIRRIISTYRPYRKQMGVVLLSVFAMTSLNLVVPLMIPLVYDDALVHGKIDLLILYIMIMVIATLLSGLAS